MEIQLGSERILVLEDGHPLDDVRQKAMDRRGQAFGGGLGQLLQRPKAEDIVLVTAQRRYEPFWHVAGRAVYAYERRRDYLVPASGPEVREVTIDGVGHPVADGNRAFTLATLENCREEIAHALYADGLTGSPVPDGAQVVAGARREIEDPASLAIDDAVVVPPEQRASFIVRQLLSQMLKPVQADRMLEETLALEATDLYFRPIWAFEFHWKSKDKRGVVEIDAVTGAIRSSGSLLPQLTKIVSRDALFDIGADTVGLLVPGGSIAVKVARAALDKGY
jgi:hypothetical protein